MKNINVRLKENNNGVKHFKKIRSKNKIKD